MFAKKLKDMKRSISKKVCIMNMPQNKENLNILIERKKANIF